MSETINILIVEDDKNQQQSYKDSITLFNKNHDIPISCTIKENLAESKKLLEWNIFDAAIIDLKLKGTDSDGEGNKIIKEIKYKLRYPIFVVTGFPDDLDPDLREQNIFFKIYQKGIIFMDIFNKIESIYNTGLTKILGGRGIIEGYLTDIFWNNLSNSLDNWIMEKNPEKKVLRYILTHLSEYLDLDESGAFEKYHATEVYIKPPLRTKILTGDILIEKETNKNFIILSPVCDLAQNKAEYVILAEIEPLTSGIVYEKKKLIKKDEEPEKTKCSEQILKKILNNNYSLKYYFLPYTAIYQGGLINFQKISSYKFKVIERNFTFLASISHQFVKDIISKFSSYYSRQGSPDFDEEKIYNDILSN
jgi:hypothetical protein